MASTSLERAEHAGDGGGKLCLKIRFAGASPGCPAGCRARCTWGSRSDSFLSQPCCFQWQQLATRALKVFGNDVLERQPAGHAMLGYGLGAQLASQLAHSLLPVWGVWLGLGLLGQVAGMQGNQQHLESLKLVQHSSCN